MINQNLTSFKFASQWITYCLLVVFSLPACSQESRSIGQDEYQITSDSVWIDTSNGIIFGMLYKPVGVKSKLTAVLCLQGGGDVGLANYLYEAKYFARHGLMALVCDKSGSGLSRTKKAWHEQSFVNKIDEYSELFTWLQNHSNSNENMVGVHGMSEGGRLALNLAIEQPDEVAFVNSVCGPLAPFKDNQLYALYNLLHSQNFEFPVIVEALSIWDSYFNEIAELKISDETIRRANELRKVAPNLRYLPGSTTELPNRPLAEDVHFSLEEIVNQIQCPVLFQIGERDMRVDPVMTVFLLEKKANFSIKVYKNTDHNMNFENGDMNPAFLDDKLDWLVNDVLSK